MNQIYAAEDIFLRKKIGGILLIIMLGLVVWGSHKLSHYVIKSSSIPKTSENKKIKVIIDAGHGGNDGGKKGVNGAVESEINLQIAKLLSEKLKEQGIDVLMTRETEEGMAEGNAADLRARAEMMNKEQPDLVVSIHQNSYTDAEVKGAQVFYHEESEEGEKAALIMQEALTSLDENNTRQAKPNNSYYLLKKTESPVIIVECGFLSNPTEAEKLVDPEYQEKVVEAVFVGICKYFGILQN